MGITRPAVAPSQERRRRGRASDPGPGPAGGKVSIPRVFQEQCKGFERWSGSSGSLGPGSVAGANRPPSRHQRRRGSQRNRAQGNGALNYRLSRRRFHLSAGDHGADVRVAGRDLVECVGDHGQLRGSGAGDPCGFTWAEDAGGADRPAVRCSNQRAAQTDAEGGRGLGVAAGRSDVEDHPGAQREGPGGVCGGRAAGWQGGFGGGADCVYHVDGPGGRADLLSRRAPDAFGEYGRGGTAAAGERDPPY